MLLRAAAQEQYAERAGAVAERHERILAAGTFPVAGRQTAHHQRMATLHRRMQERHLTAARLHTSFASKLFDTEPGDARTAFLAAVAAAAGATGVGITLLGSGLITVRAASGPAAAAAMDIEYTLAEGPGNDALTQGRVVTAEGEKIARNWPRYGPAVTELGIRTVTSAPLQRGSRCLGVLISYNAPTADPLEELATILLAPEHDMSLSQLLRADIQGVVHRAAGMLAVQCHCGVDDGLALIRAHAFATDTTTADVAAEILNGRLRLD